jgi:tetratricopeptide (TPR) repeat protein
VELLREGTEFAGRAIQIDSLNVRALDLRGTLRYWLGQSSEGDETERLHEQAERDLRTVTALDSTNAHAWHRLSSLYTAQGKHDDAKNAAVRALEADQYYEEREDIYKQLCNTSLNKKEWEEFTRWCAAGFREFPRSQYIFNLMAMGLSSPGGPEPDVDRIWQLLDEFLQASPPSQRDKVRPAATLYVAMVLARAGLSDSARAVIRKARDAATEPDAFYYYNEAHARLLLGERDRALDLLEHYLEARPAGRSGLRTDWWFEPLQSDPRFQDLLQ